MTHATRLSTLSRWLATMLASPFPQVYLEMNTQTLFRPVGEVELSRIRELNNLRFPPRLPEQPYFYPICTLSYAEQIARDWNTRAGGVGFVTQFDVEAALLERYPVRVVGSASIHREYWIPAAELEAFNDALVGAIRVIRRFAARVDVLRHGPRPTDATC